MSGKIDLLTQYRMVAYMHVCTIQHQLKILSASSWEAPISATGTVRKRQAVWPIHHVQNHIYRVPLLQVARRAAMLGQPSSIRPHCAEDRVYGYIIAFWLCVCTVSANGAGGGGCQAFMVFYVCKTVELVSSVYTVQLWAFSLVVGKIGLNQPAPGPFFLYTYFKF